MEEKKNQGTCSYFLKEAPGFRLKPQTWTLWNFLGNITRFKAYLAGNSAYLSSCLRLFFSQTSRLQLQLLGDLSLHKSSQIFLWEQITVTAAASAYEIMILINHQSVGRGKCSRDESDIKLYFFLSLSLPVKQHVKKMGGLTQDKITLPNLTQGGVACFNSTTVRRTLSLLVGGPKKNWGQLVRFL